MTWVQQAERSHVWVLEGSPIPTMIEQDWSDHKWRLSVGSDRETCYGPIETARRRCEWLLLDMAESCLVACRMLLGEDPE